MKFAFVLLLISASTFAKPINFDAFKVDTSTTDMKPAKTPEQVRQETAKIELLNGEQERFEPNKRYKAKRSTNVFMRDEKDKRSSTQKETENARLANPFI